MIFDTPLGNHDVTFCTAVILVSKTHLSAVGGVIRTAIICIACGNKLRIAEGALHIHLTMSNGINPHWGQNIKNYVLQGVLTPWKILSESTVLPHQSD